MYAPNQDSSPLPVLTPSPPANAVIPNTDPAAHLPHREDIEDDENGKNGEDVEDVGDDDDIGDDDDVEDDDDDEDGSDYLPVEETPSQTTNTTPLRRNPTSSRSMTSESIKRLEAIAPKICLVTHMPGNRDYNIEMCHLIPRPVNDDTKELRRMEWILGYRPDTFNLINSHYNCFWLKGELHASFDKNSWALAPTELECKKILKHLKLSKKKQAPTGDSGPWPNFRKVYRRKSGFYPYRFVNMHLENPFVVRDPASGENVAVQPGSKHPLLTEIMSHIHPFHVIVNAHKKFDNWKPLPTDKSSMKIIAEVNAIWDALNSPPPSSEFLSYRKKDNRDPPSSPTPSRSTRYAGSSTKKRDRQDDDEDNNQPRNRPRYEVPEDKEGKRPLPGRRALKELPWDNFAELSIENWRSNIVDDSAESPSGLKGEEQDEVAGSLVVGGYAGWKPEWDKQRFDTAQFSSNDWALLRMNSYLTNPGDDIRNVL